MPEIQVTKKTIDALTGGDIVTKRFFKIDESDPNNSLEYHKFADLLGVNRLDRLNPHVSGKLALLYNWAVNNSKSNELSSLASFINKAKGGISVLGFELVTSLYRKARFEMERSNQDQKDRTEIESRKDMASAFRKDSEKARVLRKEGQDNKQAVESENKKMEGLIKETYASFEASLPRERGINVKVIDSSGSKSEKLTI